MKIRKELWFGFSLMGLILATILLMTPWGSLTNGHLGLLMLALVVVTIMLGFPTAFTLMGMGVFFAWLAYRSVNPDLAVRQVLDLMVQRTYAVMSNDVLIAIPLFVFMGYLVERAALIERLFKSLHLSMARIPGSLAVATIVTCAIFATATGIVGAVVTLMGLLAFPAMLRAGYNTQLSAGAITAGGCLGILIPPSVLLIVYGATAGVSVVQLYAGAFFPGLMLAGLYVGYVIIVAKLKPELAPKLPDDEAFVPIPPALVPLAAQGRNNAFTGLLGAVGGRSLGVPARTVWGQFLVTMLPALAIGSLVVATYLRRDEAGRGRRHVRAPGLGVCGRCRGPGSRGATGRRRAGRAPAGKRHRAGRTAGVGHRAGRTACQQLRRCRTPCRHRSNGGEADIAGGRHNDRSRARRRNRRLPTGCRCRRGSGSSPPWPCWCSRPSTSS